MITQKSHTQHREAYVIFQIVYKYVRTWWLSSGQKRRHEKGAVHVCGIEGEKERQRHCEYVTKTLYWVKQYMWMNWIWTQASFHVFFFSFPLKSNRLAQSFEAYPYRIRHIHKYIISYHIISQRINTTFVWLICACGGLKTISYSYIHVLLCRFEPFYVKIAL